MVMAWLVTVRLRAMLTIQATMSAANERRSLSRYAEDYTVLSDSQK